MIVAITLKTSAMHSSLVNLIDLSIYLLSSSSMISYYCYALILSLLSSANFFLSASFFYLSLHSSNSLSFLSLSISSVSYPFAYINGIAMSMLGEYFRVVLRLQLLSSLPPSSLSVKSARIEFVVDFEPFGSEFNRLIMLTF